MGTVSHRHPNAALRTVKRKGIHFSGFPGNGNLMSADSKKEADTDHKKAPINAALPETRYWTALASTDCVARLSADAAPKLKNGQPNKAQTMQMLIATKIRSRSSFFVNVGS